MQFFRALIYQLSMMRTAVGLLAVCALASMAGTVVPQGLPLQDYVVKWGVTGAEVLWYSGLTDVFRAWWFLLILLVMLTSVSVCLWRNGPLIYRQMVMPRRAPLRLVSGEKYDEKILREGGFSRVGEVDGAVLWQRGTLNRLGYFFVHVGVLGVAVSGLLTGFVGWRGTLNLREKESDHVALSWSGRDPVAHFLPFEVRNEQFEIEQYPSGMPKRYATQLEVAGKTYEVEVNKPLQVGRYRFYQASFGDGGSEVKGQGINLRSGAVVPFGGKVYEKAQLADGTRVELLEFRPFTVETVRGEKPTDVGPSLDYLVQPPDAPARQLRAFLNEPEWIGVADGQRIGGPQDGAVIYKPVWLGIKDAKLWPLVARVANGEGYKDVVAPVLAGIADEKQRVDEGLAVMNAAKMMKTLELTHVLALRDFELRRYSGLQVVYDPAANWFWLSALLLLAGTVLMLGKRFGRVWVVKGKMYGRVGR